MKPHLFGFSSLDEILQAFCIRESALASEMLHSASVGPIGPLVEYAYQQTSMPNLLPPVAECFSGEAPRRLMDVLATAGFEHQGTGASLVACSFEFTRIPSENGGLSSPLWTAFCKRLQNAAERAGFSKRVAAGITGAFGEMVDNIGLHCERPETAVAAYRSVRGEFEFVVADAGVGVLQSLRTCPAYQGIHDHGTALLTALTTGESRFGRGSGHGWGFHEVFVRLANLYGSLRFRSGDHSVKIDGTTPELSSAQTAQCPPHYQGLLVSVLCRP